MRMTPLALTQHARSCNYVCMQCTVHVHVYSLCPSNGTMTAAYAVGETLPHPVLRRVGGTQQYHTERTKHSEVQ